MYKFVNDHAGGVYNMTYYLIFYKNGQLHDDFTNILEIHQIFFWTEMCANSVILLNIEQGN